MHIKGLKSKRFILEAVEPRLLLSKTVYVDASAAGAVHDGTSWNTAFVDLQQGLAAAVAGDEIHVADGIYRLGAGSQQWESFQLRNSVAIRGGYAGLAPDPNARDTSSSISTLSGDIGILENVLDNSWHVLRGAGTDASAVLDGFTIQDGHAFGSTDDDQGGGGLFNDAGSPTISNCIFKNNSAHARGGAVYNRNGSAPIFINCQFIENNGGAFGGAVENISANSIWTNCTFVRNRSKSNGGGIETFGKMTLTNCSFLGNSTSNVGGHGGGIYVANNSSSVITNCLFSGNQADVGGGLYCVTTGTTTPTLINCTFSGNVATVRGGGIFFQQFTTSTFSVQNCVIWGNTAPTGPNIIQGGTKASSISYCDIEGGWTGTGNINLDPKFVRAPSAGFDAAWCTLDDDCGDLRLRINSPCIDAGSNAVLPAGITTDLDGNPRKVDVTGVHDPGAIVDMGAYERAAPFTDGAFVVAAARPRIEITFSQAALPSSVSASDLILVNLTSGQPIDSGSASQVTYDVATLPAGNVTDLSGQPILSADLVFDFFALGGDANRDRKVDINDLAILAANWNGSGKVFSQGDFNYDGRVDAIDLGILSSRWQQNLPPPAAPAQPISLSKRAPTRTASRVASIVLV